MMDTQQMRAMLGQALGAGPADNSELEARAKQGRLTFAATVGALRNGCTCEPCVLLRQAVDLLLADTKKEAAGHG